MNNTLTYRFFSRVFLIIVFGLSLSLQGHSQSSVLYSDTDSVTAGQVFNLSIKVQLNQQYSRVQFPDSASLPLELEVRNTQQFRLTDFTDSLQYSVQYFGNTDLNVLPLPIALISENDTSYIYTNPISIPFKSILPSEDAELKPLKPILSLPAFPWAVVVIILVLVAAAIWAYYTFFKAEPAKKVVKVVQETPFLNPLSELEEMLLYLKNEYTLSDTKDYKFFYSSLSDSVRKYFEDLYNIPALESTTRELLRYLDAFGVDPDMIKSTRTILNKSDMVKFAKFTPTLEKAWTCYQETVDFMDRARLVDASRISRKRIEHESQWKTEEIQPEHEVHSQTKEDE